MTDTTTAFDWHDGGRLVHYGSGRLAEVEQLVGGGGFTLLSTSRAVDQFPDVARLAGSVLEVPQATSTRSPPDCSTTASAGTASSPWAAVA